MRRMRTVLLVAHNGNSAFSTSSLPANPVPPRGAGGPRQSWREKMGKKKMKIGIETIDASSLNLCRDRPNTFSRNNHKKAAKAIFLTSLLMTFVGCPVLVYASLPVLQIAQPLFHGTTPTNMIGICGHFLGFYFQYHRFPNLNDWIWFLIGQGLSIAVSIAVASILVHLGWITMAAATAVLSATGVGIGLAAAIVAF